MPSSTAPPGFLPIAAGHHAARYLVALLTGVRYAVAALDELTGRGSHLPGLPEHWVSIGVLAAPPRRPARRWRRRR